MHNRLNGVQERAARTNDNECQNINNNHVGEVLQLFIRYLAQQNAPDKR